ncbi:MAG: glycosyltransferase [Bacteroidota bacterium]|nr:glycosyltransferase [Bacteroidota bacterium]
MHILIISHYYPPLNSIASLRPYFFAKIFAENKAEVTVITTKKNSRDGHLDLTFPLTKNVNVIEIDYMPLFFWKKRTALGENSSLIDPQKNFNKKGKNKLKEFLKSIADSFGSLLDHQTFWKTKAFLAARKVNGEKKIDIVISTFSPIACHLVAYKLIKSNPDIKWIADYRDLWSLNHFRTGKFVFNWIEKQLERRILKKASHITTVSEPLAQQLSEFTYGAKPVSIIYNGYDRERKNKNLNDVQLNNPIRIVYTGTIYQGKSDPSPLFHALNLLAEKGVLKKGELIVEFYGSLLGNLEEIIVNCSASEWAVIKGHVAPPEIAKIQEECDFLLFLWSNEGKRDGVLTGKLFEYISSNTPIMAIGIDDKSSAAELISETKTGFIFENNVQLIADFLEHVKQNPENLVYNPDWNAIESYSRQKQALKLFEIAKSLNHLS